MHSTAPSRPVHRRPLHVLIAERDDELRLAVAGELRDRGFATSETIEPAVVWGIAPFMDIVVLGDCLGPGETFASFGAELRAMRAAGQAGEVSVVPLTTIAAVGDACDARVAGPSEELVPG